MSTKLSIRMLVVLLLLIGNQFAKASESGEANVSTDKPSQLVKITDYRYEPIYGDVPYQDTCSREVVDGYTRVCESSSNDHDSGSSGGGGGGGSSCHTSSDTVCNSHGCTTVPRRSCSFKSIPAPADCYDRPTYRTEYYTCTRYRREIVDYRKVKTFNNDIEVILAQPEEFKGADLKVRLNVEEDKVSAELISSFPKAAVVANIREISAQDQRTEKNSKIQVMLDATVAAELIKRINNVSIQDLVFGFRKVSFNIAEGADIQGMLFANFDLNQVRKLIRDKTIFSDEVAKAAFKMEKVGSTLKAEIDFGALGIGIKSKKAHNVSVNVGIQIPQIINAKDFSSEFNKKPAATLESVYAQ